MEILSNSCTVSTKEITLKNNNTRLDQPEVKLPHNVEQLFKHITAQEGFTSYKMSRGMIPNNGGNYLGELCEVNMKGETKEGSKEIYMFLKLVISGGVIDRFVNIETCFSHEVLFYTDLSNVFINLQNEANVPEGERFKTAKSYGCISEAIVLENLANQGFITLNRMDVIPLEFAELSITQLAKLHGLSFVLQHKITDYFEKHIKTLESSQIFDDFDAWIKYTRFTVKMTTAYLSRDIQEKITYFLRNSYDKLPKYICGKTDSVKCLSHGDFRISNVMMKQSDKEESQVVLIDYQLLLCRSPVIDLLFFFYTGTDRKFRKTHMNDLKNLYHDKLTEFLLYFDININDVYPKKVYEKDFNDFLDYGLLAALYYSIIIFPLEDDVPDFHKNTFDDITFKLDDRFKNRIIGIVEDYMEWGILE